MPGLRSVRTVLGPLVLPEFFVALIVALPVSVHVLEQLGAALCFEDFRDVGVRARGVAVRLVGAVAVVGPGVRLLSANP